MASSWHQQALIEAPVERIWELLADPARYPEWAADSLEVTGLPTEVKQGSTFEQTSPAPLGWGKTTTTFMVEELDDLHEIKLRCQKSGYYSRWRLTEAQGQTFTDVEIGVEPIGIEGRFLDLVMTKKQLRRVTDESLDGLRRACGGPEEPAGRE
jgi:uncharacterized protein YndB with AHSA1/START domain